MLGIDSAIARLILCDVRFLLLADYGNWLHILAPVADDKRHSGG